MVEKMPASMHSEIYENYCKLLEKPEVFEDKSLDITKNLQFISKEWYDHLSSKTSFQNAKTNFLRNLLIEGFDAEQIWQQVLLRNKSLLEHFNATFQNDVSNSSNVDFQESSDIEMENADNYSSNDESMGDGNKEFVFDEDDDDDNDYSNNPIEMLKEQQKNADTEKKKDSTSCNQASSRKSHFKTPVDDQFFKLSKLEQFLKLEDLKEERKDSGETMFQNDDGEDDDDGEEDIDLFKDIPSDHSDDFDSDEESKAEKFSKDLMYEDFFDAPDSGDENGMEDDGSEDEFGNEEFNEMNEVEEDQEPTSSNSLPKVQSSFEKEQEKVRKKIAEYEDSMLQPASWQLTGEVAASNRPLDSLIHEQTDFESKARAVVIEDNDLNLKLEDMAKRAIKNKAYNDGERKQKTKAEEIAFRKETVLEQTKSKKGLAEVYEDDFLKKQKKQEEEEDPKHTAIKKQMDTLFPELYALFCHIPKPAIPDVRIVSNLPAVTVEEVAPTSISDVTLLAPEEVKRKSGLVKSQTERTDTDRKRERRKKKILQRKKFKKMENQQSEDKSKHGKMGKQEKIEALKKLKKYRNTKIAAVDGKSIKSSKDFFTQLQEITEEKKKSKTKLAKKS